MSWTCVRGPGHPDAVADAVAASVVAFLQTKDPSARTRVRVIGGHGALFIAGEVCSHVDADPTEAVKRTLAEHGVHGTMEPYIALEYTTGATDARSREAAGVFGYATRATPERVVLVQALAMRMARALEARRAHDEGWFWLGSDYDITAEELGGKPMLVVRAEYSDAIALADVRKAIVELAKDVVPEASVRVNPAGEELPGGIAKREGASGLWCLEQGLWVPNTPSGVGRESLHPYNVGRFLARLAARAILAQSESSQSVAVSASWLPLESRAHRVRVRDDQGKNLSKLLPADFFDLQKVSETMHAHENVSQWLRFPYESLELPWERDAF